MLNQLYCEGDPFLNQFSAATGCLQAAAAAAKVKAKITPAPQSKKTHCAILKGATSTCADSRYNVKHSWQYALLPSDAATAHDAWLLTSPFDYALRVMSI